MLGERFATQPNALNLIRLVLAATVVISHAAEFLGSGFPAPIFQLLNNVPVDAFFAISGFLICRSWAQRPDLRAFLVARVARILPGLCGALIVTAFVIVPILINPPLLGQLTYVAGNALTLGAAGLDAQMTDPQLSQGVWNGPLWTLAPEAACYLLVAYLGVSRRLSIRTFAVLATILWSASLGVTLLGISDPLNSVHFMPRLGLMFTSGALLWLLRDRVPASGWLALAATILVAMGSFTPNYRLLAAPALAYLCLYLAVVLGLWKPFVLRGDLSYGVYVYGWPVQQAVLLLGFSGSWVTFALVSLACTLPFAAASWVLIERPAIRLRHRVTKPVDTRVPAAAVG